MIPKYLDHFPFPKTPANKAAKAVRKTIMKTVMLYFCVEKSNYIQLIKLFDSTNFSFLIIQIFSIRHLVL